jgi:invasion protein IalB
MSDVITPGGFLSVDAGPKIKTKRAASSPAPVLAMVAVALASVAAGWFGHGYVLQTADTPTVRVFDNWRLSCPMRSQAEQACELDQNAVDTQSGAVVVRVGIGGNAARPAVDISTPVNVLLPAGLSLKIDDDAAKVFPYRTCGANGCLTTIAGDPNIRAALLKAKKVTVSFSSLEGKAISYPLSMGQFDAAAAALGDAEAKRHSWFRRMFL